jgi:DHA1 family tetracycline resistance protein-like MFS transporter
MWSQCSLLLRRSETADSSCLAAAARHNSSRQTKPATMRLSGLRSRPRKLLGLVLALLLAVALRPCIAYGGGLSSFLRTRRLRGGGDDDSIGLRRGKGRVNAASSEEPGGESKAVGSHAEGRARQDRAKSRTDNDVLHVISNVGLDVEGKYVLAGEMNSQPRYQRNGEGERLHLYWTGSQWTLHRDLDPSLDLENCLAYSKSRSAEGGPWFVKVGSAWVPEPSLKVTANKPSSGGKDEVDTDAEAQSEMWRRLRPLYALYILDSVCAGIALPALPFYIMGLGANAFMLSLVISTNYMAQTLGCAVMGGVSDRFGRKPVLLGCLVGSFLSNLIVSQSTSLPQVTFGRIVGGIMGGMTPIAQSAIADVVPLELRPKFMGRLQASVGAGFILGPTLVTLLKALFAISTRSTFLVAMLFPLMGLLVCATRLQETKSSSSPALDVAGVEGEELAAHSASAEAIPLPIMLLVFNGFLLMYAFSIESVYAMFIKDNFGYGETVLSTLFALNGLMVGILQVFFMKSIVGYLGKHVMLITGNALLALGMAGLSVVRNRFFHFVLFSVHILGYSMADTALVTLISRYAGKNMQGRSLGLNQAAQSTARVISPLIAGILYERSKRASGFPPGALPYLIGSLFPLAAISLPATLYLRNVELKKKKQAL